jgi:signal transduction histidine kinase
MNARNGFTELARRPALVAGVLAVAIAAVEVAIDWSTWIELNVSIVYTLPLVLAAAARSRRLLWTLVVVLVGTTFAVYAAQVGPGTFSLREPLFVNRVLAAATMLLMASLLHAWTRALDELDAQDRALRDRNAELDAANHELVRCRDEITRQNAELDRRRQEAEDSSGRKSRLLASVSHDLRSPLNAISLTAQVIRRTAGDPTLAEQIPVLAQRLHANAAALGALVADVLDIAAVDSGRLCLHAAEFSLDELLAEECRRLLPLAQAKDLRLTAELPGPPIRLRTDRVKLARVLDNLLTNAIKFTAAGGVTASADRVPGGAVLVQVRDTGVGIAAQNLDKIFDELAQLPDPARDRHPGWGLGLAICRRLVELMGGTIRVESEPGQGSTFTVWLPPACAADASDGAGLDGAPLREVAPPSGI